MRCSICLVHNPFTGIQDGSVGAWQHDHERRHHADHEHDFTAVSVYNANVVVCAICNVCLYD